MKQIIGFTSGLALAAAGTAIGVYLAWLGFASAPHNGQQLGMFCGLMGALVGCFWAFIGALAGHWLRHFAAAAPSQAA